MDASAVVRPEPEGIQGGPLKGNSLVLARALLCGVGFLMMGRGLQNVLLGVRAEYENFGTAVGSFVLAIYYLGFLVGTKVTLHFLGTVGHIRVFAALSSVTSATALVFAVWVDPATWTILQFITGACVAGLSVTSESWLNDMSTNENRGRLLAMYMLVMMGSISLGQLLLNLSNPLGFELFVLASALISLALVPVALSASRAPALTVAEPMPMRRLFSQVPLAVVTSSLCGAALGVMWGLGAFYAATEGLPVSRITLFTAAPVVGCVAFQWPVGLLSDRVQRRHVVFGVAAIASAMVAIHGLFIEPGTPLSLLLMFVAGGMAYPLYSLAIALMADSVSIPQLNSASASLVRFYGIGSVVGPSAAGVVMAITEPKAFYYCLLVSFGLIVVYVIYRMIFYDALPVEEQGKFVAWPARASAMAANLLSRTSARAKSWSEHSPVRRRRK